jgi:hypothetical protein
VASSSRSRPCARPTSLCRRSPTRSA